MFAKIQNAECIEWAVSFHTIKRENSNVSFPRDWTGGVIDDVEYVLVKDSPIPEHDSWTQCAVQVKPVFSNGVWTASWEIKDLPEETVLYLRKTASDGVIKNRAELLRTTDWTQLPDVPLSSTQKAEWAAYRQQLRDITAQAGFPTNIVWPQAPGQSLEIGVARV